MNIFPHKLCLWDFCHARIELNPEITKFEDFKPDDVKIGDYPREYIKKKNPQLKFPLGI